MLKYMLASVLVLLSVQPPGYQRILFVGNSLTVHFPAPALDWPYMHGMAADATDRDYVHRLQLFLAARQGFVPEIAIVSADVNRWHNVTGRALDGTLASEFGADLVIVQMGDNARSDADYDWVGAYREIASWAPGARFLALGVWAPNRPGHDEHIRAAAQAAGMEFVGIADLHIFGVTDARHYTAPGVGWHPGDLGMERIAERVLAALDVRRGWLPWVEGGGGGTVPPQ